jgi:hypothetical protein
MSEIDDARKVAAALLILELRKAGRTVTVEPEPDFANGLCISGFASLDEKTSNLVDEYQAEMCELLLPEAEAFRCPEIAPFEYLCELSKDQVIRTSRCALQRGHEGEHNLFRGNE